MKNLFRIFLNHTTNAGVTYYRMISPAKYMRKIPNVEVAYSFFYPNQNITAEWEMKLDSPANRGDIIKDLDGLMKTSDISVWQMLHNQVSLALWLAYRFNMPQKKMLMELDDWVFGVNPESMAFESYFPNSNLEYISERQMINASGLIVSTKYLQHEIEKYWEYWCKYRKFDVQIYRGNKYIKLPRKGRLLREPRIEVIPNGIDFEEWDKVLVSHKKKKVVIGWAGGQAHARDLNILKDVIPEILKRHNNVEFVFWGMFPEFTEPTGRIIHNKKWVGIDKYPQELGNCAFDIGLAPLEDNVFNRCKSNLRWLEYSALKIPTVASPVEPFNKTQSGDSILYAKTAQEWIDNLDLLIKNKTKRMMLGHLSYQMAKRYYNISPISCRYIEVLHNIYEDKDLEKRPIYT